MEKETIFQIRNDSNEKSSKNQKLAEVTKTKDPLGFLVCAVLYLTSQN